MSGRTKRWQAGIEAMSGRTKRWRDGIEAMSGRTKRWQAGIEAMRSTERGDEMERLEEKMEQWTAGIEREHGQRGVNRWAVWRRIRCRLDVGATSDLEKQAGVLDGKGSLEINQKKTAPE
jgi:hypothetical protein